MNPYPSLASIRGLLLIFAAILPLYLACAQAEESEFPGRAAYYMVKTIEIEDLRAQLDSVHVVDVRSAYEYETLHIKDAHHIALNDPAFADKVRALKTKANKPVVFYCNGKTCYKSYKATQKAVKKGIPGVYSYDRGIFDWSKAHPDQAVLLGRTPIDPERLISGDTFKAHQLSPEEFGTRVYTTQAVVLDVRDGQQRAGTALFPNRQQNIALDDKKGLKALLARVRKEGRPLLVYDEAGKQVRWFQYYLEDQGITDYHFMKGGSKAFFKEVLAGG